MVHYKTIIIQDFLYGVFSQYDNYVIKSFGTVHNQRWNFDIIIYAIISFKFKFPANS